MFKIPHSKPTISSQDTKAVLGVVHSGNLAQGKQVASFEKKIAQYHKVKGAVAINSGTSALHLALLALNVKKGDEVIVPTYVCTALLNAVNLTQAKIRLVDVNEDFNISIEDTKRKINRKTRAIIIPHMFGLPVNLSPFLKLGIPVIEDCAQSVGAQFQGQRVGSLSPISIFSFYATKVMATGEGGMVISNQKKLLDKIFDLRDYDNKSDYHLRFNYKMTDFQAALGVAQLSRLNTFIRQRQGIAKRYHKAFQDLDLILPSGKGHIYFRYVIRIKKNRNRLLKLLQQKGIGCGSPVFKPLHQYLNQQGFPIADRLMREAISIPIYPSLKKQQIQYIIKHVRNFLLV